jgi:hypothetical protein
MRQNVFLQRKGNSLENYWMTSQNISPVLISPDFLIKIILFIFAMFPKILTGLQPVLDTTVPQ